VGVIDLNRANLSLTSINTAVNALLDKVVKETPRDPRDYLGASSIGSECLRKIQYDWQVASDHDARTMRIFQRGHSGERDVLAELGRAGFRIETGTKRCEFEALDSTFKGHCDGIICDGPSVEGLKYPCLWENKVLGDSGWKKLERDGLRSAYPYYADQVALYAAYLELDENPALFTAVNANTCHFLAVAVPFDAEYAQAASDRAVMIIKATRAHELLPRAFKEPTNWHCKLCSHQERCWRN